MKWCRYLLPLLALFASHQMGDGAPGSEKPLEKPLLRIVFPGISSLQTNQPGNKFLEIWNLPLTTQLREQTLQRLARAPRVIASNRFDRSTPDGSILIRPLLNDLVSSEWLMEMDGTVDFPGLLLAVRAGAKNGEVWEKNLSKLVSTWKGGATRPLKTGSLQGWELKKKSYPEQVRLLRQGDWVFLAVGPEATSRRLNDAVAEFQKSGRPFAASTNWLELQARAEFLERVKNPLLPLDLTNVSLRVVGRGENLRVDGTLGMRDQISWTQENWRIPTNLLYDPLISFTAARGVSSLVDKVPELKQWGMKPAPNQFFIWSQSVNQIPFLSQLAFPHPEPSRLLHHLSERLPQVYNRRLGEHGLGDIRWGPDKKFLSWAGLPFVVPKLEVFPSSQPEFLYFSLFPKIQTGSPPPPELYSELINKPNLVYYDWEITSLRLEQWRHMGGLAQILPAAHASISNRTARLDLGRLMNRTNLLGNRWLLEVEPNLGNSVTLLTTTKPQELTVLRSSHLALTSYEVYRLAQWLEDPAFPFGSYRIGGTRTPAAKRRP